MPPVVQPTVINALAAGANAADAVASVAAANGASVHKPVVKATKLPPAAQRAQKPAVPTNRRATPPSPSKMQAAVSPKHPAVEATRPAAKPAHKAAEAAANPAAAGAPPSRSASVKQHLSADRPPPSAGMARCPLCARDFAADRLAKHEEVCRRTRDRDRKRKVFDVSKKRLEAVAADAGVDVASFKKKVSRRLVRNLTKYHYLT